MYFNRIPKFVLLGTLTPLVLGGVVGFANFAAAAPGFNIFPVSYTQQTGYDYPMIDARNVSAGGVFSATQADHDNGVQANAGDEIEFQIYYHNGAVPEDVANNVMVRASLPGGTRQSHEVSASVSSDQTSAVTSSGAFRGGNIVVYVSGQAQTLDFISGSVRWYPSRTTTAQSLANSDNLVGSGVNVGTVQGCFQFSSIITFRARVGSQSVVNPDRSLSINKQVLNVSKGETSYNNSTFASPGDRVRFRIDFSTSGNASQDNVIVRDLLPSQFSYISGTEQLDGLTVGNEYDLFGSGRNVGSLSAGASRSVTFEATVAGAGVFSGTTNLTNTANVRSDQVGTRQDDANVVVQLVLGVSFSLRKTAFNLTQGVDATTVAANPGDIISYTLYYKNTGQTTIQNAVIEDNVHDVLELAEITDQGGAVSVNSVIRYAPIDVPAGVEISRGFQVRVRNASLFPADSDLVMTNIYGNEVRVPVRKPQILGAMTPPRTGAGEWMAVTLASLVTLGFWVYKKTRVKYQIS